MKYKIIITISIHTSSSDTPKQQTKKSKQLFLFHLLDEDKSGALDQQEVFDAIKRHVQGSGLSSEEMDTLASFVIHQAELDSEQWGENGQVGVIELAEWDNLFTSGHADFHSLSRMIKHLDKSEASFLLDRAKSFRQSLGQDYGSIEKNV